MEESPSSSGSRVSLYDKIKAMRQRHAQQRALERGETPTSAPPNEVTPNAQPQSSVPARLTSEAPPAMPRLASPLLLAHNSARSPSAVPHLEPLPVITLEEVNTSERFETLLPQAQEGDGGTEPQQNGTLAAAGTMPKHCAANDDPEKASVYALPISLVGPQRDQYPQMVYFYRDTIQRFLGGSNPDAELLAATKHFVERVRRIAMHPDLDNEETLTQHDVTPSQQASWDVNCSAKFRFLKELFECMRNEALHVAIAAQPARIMDILETFLQGIKVSYNRPGATKPRDSLDEGRVEVTLLTADVDICDTVGTVAVDLVIAMDNSTQYDTEQIRALRKRSGKWAPFITLVVPRTVEHVERWLTPTLSGQAFLRALVAGIYQFRNEAGKLEEGQHAPKDAAAALARYLTSSTRDAEWPLATLSTLEDFDSQTESEVDPDVEVEPAVEDENAVGTAIRGRKRSREPDDVEIQDMDSSKRARIELSSTGTAPGIPSARTPQDIDITHISDSHDKTTQSNAEDEEARGASDALGATETRLQELLQAVQQRLAEHVRALSDLQYRHEEQRNQFIAVTNERDVAISTAQQAITRLSEQANNFSTVKVQRTELQEQLKDANAKLLDHSVPERADFEQLRLAAVEANAEKEKSGKTSQGCR